MPRAETNLGPCGCCGVSTCCCPDRQLGRRLRLTLGPPPIPAVMAACLCFDGVSVDLNFKGVFNGTGVGTGADTDLPVWATDSFACVTSFGCRLRLQFFLSCGRSMLPGEINSVIDTAGFALESQGTTPGASIACEEFCPFPCAWTLLFYFAYTPDNDPVDGCEGCGAAFQAGWRCVGCFEPVACDPLLIEVDTGDITVTQCDSPGGCSIPVTVTEIAA